MLPDLLTIAGPILLAGPEDGVKSLTDLIQENVVPLVITIVAVFGLFAARKGEVSNVVTILLTVIIGLCILAMALPGPRDAVIDLVSGWFS